MIQRADSPSDAGEAIETDGGVQTADYLDAKINLFKPATPFMADHLKVVWLTFLAWIIIVFGPTTLAFVAPGVTEIRVAGAPALFMMTAIGTPLGALLLSIFYAYQRDRLDEKYGIDHEAALERTEETATAADGGEPTDDGEAAQREQGDASTDDGGSGADAPGGDTG